MNLTQYLQAELGRMHDLYERALGDLAPEQWYYLPMGKSNHIAWNAWHFFRTEDNIVRFILQNRRPTVWVEDGYAEKLGLHPVAQGTGMSLTDAQALRLGDTALFLDYARRVRAAEEEWLAGGHEDTYGEIILVRPLGEMPRIRALGQVCLSHGWGHLGEIDHIRALLDLPGIGI